jgi:NAD(P)H-flavin reductase
MSTECATTPFLPQKAIIRQVTPLALNNHLFDLRFDEPSSLKECMPGQFVQLWIPGVGEAPISVCSGAVDGTMQLCVHKIGAVTSALFDKSEGDWVGLRGPFGTGFPIDSWTGRDLVLIAGGLGVAPIRSLWQYVLDHREQFGKVTIIYGMRHSQLLLFRQEFKLLLRRRDIHVYIAAEEVVGPDLPSLLP